MFARRVAIESETLTEAGTGTSFLKHLLQKIKGSTGGGGANACIGYAGKQCLVRSRRGVGFIGDRQPRLRQVDFLRLEVR